MNAFLAPLTRGALWLGLGLLLALPAAAFEFTYSPTNTQPGTVYLNGTAVQLADRFQLTPYQGSSTGSMVLDNLPKTPIKAFAVRFGLQMTNTSSTSVMADGVSFNFGPGITTDSVASEKGITSGLAVAFDTYVNTDGDRSWVPGISIRWNGADLATTNISSIFNSLKTTTNFYDVLITLQPAQNEGGLSTVTVQYQGVVLSAQIQYSPTSDQTWRMMFAARTGANWSQQAINQIRVSGTATELTVFSPYGKGQTTPAAGTFNPAAFAYTYDPATLPAGTMSFNGAAANRTNLFLLTPNQTGTNGSIILNNLPQVPITEFTARLGLRMANYTNRPLADGVSINFGPRIATNALVDETGITTGLAVCFDTYWATGEASWVPGLAIRWNKTNIIASTNIWQIFQAGQTSSNFNDVTITLQPLDNSAGLSTVTVEYQGVTLSGQVPYAPATNEPWGVILGARTGGASSEQALNRIQLSGTSLQPAAAPAPVGDRLTPSPGVHEITEKAPVVLQAPDYVYLDRYRRELDPTPENINSIAHYRARLDNPAATVTPSGGAAAYGIANGASINLDRDTTVTWHWVVDHLAEVDPGTSGVTNLSATDITDAAHVDTLGRRYLPPGTTGFDSLVFRSVTAAQQGNVRFGSRGYVMENAPNSPERYLELAGEGDHLRTTAASPVLPAGATNYTLEFWARRNLTTGDADQVVLGLGSANGAGRRLLAGFGGDRGFFVSDGAVRVTALPGWTDEEWHHWAAVCRGNGASNSVALYRDGVLVQQSTAVLAPFGGDGTVTIGARAVGDYATAFFSGGVNNVRVWGRTLERTNLYVALATKQFSTANPDVLLEMPFDTAPTNAAAGVHVARLNYPIDTNPGALRFETWDGLSTTDNSLDSTLLVDPRYPNYPSFATFTPTFDSRPVYPDDSHDGYGGRISGWIIPQETANYRFFLKCDDSARLFLSPDDDPNHLVQVAYQTSFTNAFAEPAANNPATTALIGLQAGRRYAVMALWKESAGNDFCTVAWRKDGDPTPATSLTPVPGSVLSAPSFATPAFTQLAGATVVESYQAANFLLPSTNAVPLRPPGFGSDAWHHRSRFVAAAGGRYTFTLQAGGPAQCWVDGRLLINRPDTNSPATASISLTPGSHLLETWMVDPGGPRALSLTYSPDSVTTPAALPDSSLFLAASDLLALGQVTTTSTEGKGLVFVARGFEGLFPANTAVPTLLAAIMPGFRLGLTALEGGQNTVQIDPIGKAPLNDWRRVFWGWKKEFQFTIGVMCVDEDGLPVVSKLPYFAGEVAEANVDGSTSDTAAPFGSGVVNVHNLWLQEGERLSVGTIYRTLDRRFTLDGISGNLNAFSDITLDKLIDGARSNGVSREYLFPGVFGPGSLNFSYGRTIHRVNIPLGQGFDVSSLAAVNAVLYPELPEGATNLLVNQGGPSASDTTPTLNGSLTGGNGAGWMWDFVGKKWHPTKPGQFTLSWPDVAGYTNQIEVHAGFPGDTEVYSGFLGFENKDGTRLGSATNRNRYTYTYPGVATNYPGAPAAHYTYNIAPDGALPAPADLDPKPNDGWFFKEFSYAENNTAQVANNKIFTDTGASNRSVFVWTRRLDPAQIATGDLSRESIVVRVSQSQARTNQAAGVVGARLESPDDLAGFHSGRITPTANSRNYNPSFYNTNAAVGQWGPVYPVNHWASSNQVGQSLTVDWYYNTATLIAGEPVSYKPRITTIYTNLSWPDATNPATPVIYISSQMGSEGVGQSVSTNNGPNYQEILAPAKYANLAIYNQPNRNAIGYNPNEEHALIAPSKAYVLTGDPRFNLGQNAAFALQNGLNNSNKDSTNASSSYTSDPFVLVQYSVPGATNASDAFGMKMYAVKTVREGDASFPRFDVVTGTAFETSGQPVPQPANPTYAFQYTAVAGSVVTAPYPLALVIGNVVLPNTVGGNLIDDNTANATRSLWQDKNGTHWVVSGGGNARFFERYFYPLRADFWLGDGQAALAAGTPVAWAPPAATNAVNGTNLHVGPAALPVAAKYQAVWGNQYPVLKRGETLTYAGGEYKADHPASPGLPAVLNMASAELVFDSSTPSMVLNNQPDSSTNDWTLVPGVRLTTYSNEDRKAGYIEHIRDVFVRDVESSGDFPSDPASGSDGDRGFGGKFSVFGRTTRTTLTIPDLLPRSKELGSDGWKKRTYAYWMRTLLKIDVAGSYTFYLQSGDGSRLYLSKDPVTIVPGDGTDTTTSIATSSANSPLLVDADGYIEYNNFVNQEVQYIQASGTQALSPGYYVLQVQYFQQGPKSGTDNTTTHPKFALQYECLSAGIARQAIPAGRLFRDPYDEDLADSDRRHYPEVQPFTSLSARVTRPLDRYAASISKESIPQDLQPANPAKVLVSGSRWYFKDLSASLGQRFYYDSLVGQLVFRGRLNNLESGAPDLTRQPVQPYVLEPNFLTDEDVATLKALTDQPSQGWLDAIDQLQVAASTEFTTGSDTGLGVTAAGNQTALAFYTSTESDVETTPTDIGDSKDGVGSLVPISSFGIGSALVPSPSALDHYPNGPIYVALAENNDPRASGAVALHIIQLSEERYRGSIQVLTPQDAFSEKINLKHTGDFGGNTAEIYYQWWVSNVTPLDQAGRPDVVTSTNWQVYKEGLGLNSIAFEGDPITTLADKFFFVRYGGSNELYLADNGNRLTTNGSVSASSWRQVLPDSVAPDWTTTNGVPYQWAGAANSPQLQADGSKRYLPQLVMGWVKRVLDQINPYEARYSATFNGDAPATYASMLQQAGGPYIGPVALNSDKNNLENVGLIALYETVLQRAKDLTQGAGADAGTDQALLLAATRLASLYSLLGNEAWSDAQTGILPQSPDLDDDAASYLFAFKNEVATPLDEQLALLRGTDFLKAYPSFNRLFWNYLKADGEAAYNAVYNISDANSDGLIDESDAAIQYPMGHGDAWGHYLSAVKMHYDLLRRPGFTWQARAELYSLLGNVLPVDYLDEKTFATLAAARARAGVSILKATYAQSYSSDPAAQWQGYTDTANPARAWGVSEWTRRTGQGAWFDWLAANAMTPAPGTNAVEGLDRIDRAANQAEVATLSSALVELQQELDNANRGQNPIGLDADAMAFDIDPFYDGVWWERAGQFQQVYDRAVAAANNALAAYNFARRSDQQLRRLANDTAALKTEALKQDLDYRNRLIAIYGRPYQGTVGPGKIFAEGYEGPDLVTYMYMDVLSTDGLMPQVQGQFVWQASLDNDVVGVGNGLDFHVIGFDPNTAGGNPADPFLPGNPIDFGGNYQNQLIFSNSYLIGNSPGRLILDAPNHPGDFPGAGDTVVRFNLPYYPIADWALQSQPDWGSRPAYGKIQSGLNDILATQVELEVALESYHDYLSKMEIKVFYARQKMDALREKLQFINYYEGLAIGNVTFAYVLTRLDDVLKNVVKKMVGGSGRTVAFGTGHGQILQVGKGNDEAIAVPDREEAAVPNNFTLAGGGDIFSPLRVLGALGKNLGIKEFEKLKEELARLAEELELESKISEIAKDAGKDTIDAYNEFLDVLKDLSLDLAEEESQRAALMAPLQKLNWAEVSTQIAEGERLQMERAALNRQIAASAQRNRYADLVVRLTRNEAVRKFDAALDNALRYAWLAAKAYDYETSLSEGHPAGINSLLDQIVQTRSLGLWEDGQPKVGNGGLGELLARLKSNHDALKGQIGLNNAQFESSLFSLRTEAFRISTDQAWVNALKAARVPDLWAVPEFRQYCRPFAHPTNGAQPGLVIQFSTEINPGLNFFGRPLSALDHSFSGANYATKIREIGVAFPGYDEGAGQSLSISPRIYLLPVGQDMQRCSDTQFPTVRSWNVVSQRIPTPYVLNTANLRDINFQPSMDGLDGSYVDRIRFGDFRAFTTDGDLNAVLDLVIPPAPPGWSLSARLYGRSVWNTRWLLIIPGATLSADKDGGLDRFIHTVTDIKLLLQTYSNMGM